jgi:hypothetical protein
MKVEKQVERPEVRTKKKVNTVPLKQLVLRPTVMNSTKV